METTRAEETHNKTCQTPTGTQQKKDILETYEPLSELKTLMTKLVLEFPKATVFDEGREEKGKMWTLCNWTATREFQVWQSYCMEDWEISAMITMARSNSFEDFVALQVFLQLTASGTYSGPEPMHIFSRKTGLNFRVCNLLTKSKAINQIINDWDNLDIVEETRAIKATGKKIGEGIPGYFARKKAVVSDVLSDEHFSPGAYPTTFETQQEEEPDSPPRKKGWFK